MTTSENRLTIIRNLVIEQMRNEDVLEDFDLVHVESLQDEEFLRSHNLFNSWMLIKMSDEELADRFGLIREDEAPTSLETHLWAFDAIRKPRP